MILSIWVYSAPFVLLPFFEVGEIRYIPEGFMTACSYDYLNTSSDNYIFIFIYCIFAWVIPLVAIVYCYIHIMYIVLSAKKIQSSKEKNKTEMKLAGIVIGIVGLWFLAWYV
jgi:r-opsin